MEKTELEPSLKGQATLSRFSFGCAWSLLLRGLSLVVLAGATPLHSVLVSHCGGFCCCGARALGCVGFSSCGSWTVERSLSSWGTRA